MRHTFASFATAAPPHSFQLTEKAPYAGPFLYRGAEIRTRDL